MRSLQLIMNFAEDFLHNLIAPHLEEIKFPRYYIPRIEVVTSFLRRSACSLRSLSMIFSIFPQYFEGFMDLLQSMPSLTILSILSITAFEITSPEEYHPRNILQLVAKVLSSQSTSLQQGFLPNPSPSKSHTRKHDLLYLEFSGARRHSEGFVWFGGHSSAFYRLLSKQGRLFVPGLDW